MSEPKIEGGCQCGNIRYVIVGKPVMAAICHCTMCRRAHAAPVVAWAMYQDTQVRLNKDGLKLFKSSEQAQRGFCPQCGTQICFTASFLPGLIDISIGSLDNPENIKPSFHYWHDNHLSWVKFDDQLPRHPALPPFGDDED